MANRLDLRFAIGSADGPRSGIWRVLSHGNHIYVRERHAAGAARKISFHEKRICRHAFTKEHIEKHGLPATLTNRALHHWLRVPTPPEGQNGASCPLQMYFPVDYLSTAGFTSDKPVTWIAVAAPSHTTIVEMFFTLEKSEKLKTILGDKKLITYTTLPNGEAFAITSREDKWQNTDLRVTGGDSDLLISPNDPLATGRPWRLVLFNNPTDGGALTITEAGGYPVPPQKP